MPRFSPAKTCLKSSRPMRRQPTMVGAYHAQQSFAPHPDRSMARLRNLSRPQSGFLSDDCRRSPSPNRRRRRSQACSGPADRAVARCGQPQSAAVVHDRPGRHARHPPWRALSKVQSVDQRMRLEGGVGFRQLRTCRRTRPGQLCADTQPTFEMKEPAN